MPLRISSQPENFMPVATFWNQSSQIFGYLGVVADLTPPKSTPAAIWGDVVN